MKPQAKVALSRREFLKAAGTFLVWAILNRRQEDLTPEVHAQQPTTPAGSADQQWSFSLAFPAWFPVEPQIDEPIYRQLLLRIAHGYVLR